jgi:hypothetical protein
MNTRLKTPPTEWKKKILAHRTSDKGLRTRIYREFKNSLQIPSKIKDPKKKWANDRTEFFPREEVQMPRKKEKNPQE